MKEIMMNKIGNYSNGLIAFIVFQGLAYAFYFGSNELFNCIVHNSAYLAEGLSVMFFVVTVLAVYGVKSLASIEATLAPEYADIISKLTKGKIVVLLLFGLFPCFLTLRYGVFSSIPQVCL